jgi:histone H4
MPKIPGLYATVVKGSEKLVQNGIENKALRESIQNVAKPHVKRIARRGGVKRISSYIYEETRSRLKNFLEQTIRESVLYTDHAKRKTLKTTDVMNASERRGRPIFGILDVSFSSTLQKFNHF